MTLDICDALKVVIGRIPDEGITLRELFTRVAKLRGDSQETIDETIRLAEEGGYEADEVIHRGPSAIKLN